MDDATQSVIKQALELNKHGKHEDAVDLLFAIAKRQPDHESVFVLIGEIYLTNNEPKRAIRPLEVALELNQDNFRTHYLLGNAYGRILRFDEAIKELMVANEIKPNDDETIRNLGWIHCMAGRVDDGRHFLKKALEINPKNGLIYNDLAASYMFTSKRDLPNAERWLQKALSIEPEHPFIQQTYQAFVTLKNSFEELPK